MSAGRDFEWDDEKSDANLRLRGFPFATAVALFLDPDRLVIDTTRTRDGESRSKAIGKIEHRLFTVVFPMRGDVTRIISARRANTKELRAYGIR